MKTRESGMPPRDVWNGFFLPGPILKKLGLRPEHRHVLDFGCGYGTFSVPAALISLGTVCALDIEPQMVAITRDLAEDQGLQNLVVIERDFVAQGTGLPECSIDFAMLFNILHAEERETLLQEAFRVLSSGGILAVMHWRHDPATPRGPSMSIRPRPEQCVDWCRAAGFAVAEDAIIDLPLHHYAFTAIRST